MYQSKKAQEKCHNCLAGYYENAINSHNCKKCPTGYYQDEVSAHNCVKCPTGYYQNGNSIFKCIGCAKGKYQETQASTGCKECPAGYYQNALHTNNCEKCPMGYYQNQESQLNCQRCDPGKYQGEQISTGCVECPAGYYQEAKGTNNCEKCPKGYFQSDPQKDDCEDCVEGKYGNRLNSTSCKDCPEGYYQKARGTNNCEKCPMGYYQNQESNFECHRCDIGKYGNRLNSTSCEVCPAGYSSNIVGEITCTRCEKGKFNNEKGETKCDACPEGWYQNTPASWSCKECHKGKFTDEEGQSVCKMCSAGKYQNEDFKKECKKCPEGMYSSDRGNSACKSCKTDSETNKQYSWSKEGSSVCTLLTCQPGTYLTSRESLPAQCRNCPQGYKRSIFDKDITQCQRCGDGFTTSNKSTGQEEGNSYCDVCDKGTYTSQDYEQNVEPCKNCPDGYFNDVRGAKECFRCPPGKEPSPDRSLCIMPDHATIFKCFSNGGMFLNNSVIGNKSSWLCQSCPVGGNCTEPTSIVKGIRPMDGWKAMSWDNASFSRCPLAKACIWKSGNKSVCHVGHNDTASELCSQCADNYAVPLAGDHCAKCVSAHETTLLLLVAGLSGAAVFSLLVWDTLQGAKDMVPKEHRLIRKKKKKKKKKKTSDGPHNGLTRVFSASPTKIKKKKPEITRSEMPFHTIAIRIVTSYIQVAGMCLHFDVKLPEVAIPLIKFEANAGSMSKQLLLFDCAVKLRADVDLFIYRQVLGNVAIPLSASILCLLFWKCRGDRKRRRHDSEKNLIGASDGFISSMVVLYYTLFPAIVSSVAMIFSCDRYGDSSRGQSKLLLTGALSLECYSEAHWMLVLTLGVPVILFYLFIVPGKMSFVLIKQRREQKLYTYQKRYNPKWTIRLGFIFAGYREGFEWWESAVMLRKCATTIFSIFLRNYGFVAQMIAALVIMAASVSAQLQVLPYVNDYHNWLESIGLHFCMLQFSTILFGNIVGKTNITDTSYSLGIISQISISIVLYLSTLYFLWKVLNITVRSSHDNAGVVGTLSRCFRRIMPNVCKKIDPKPVISSYGKYSQNPFNVKVALPKLSDIGRQGTRKGSLRYNAKVLLHLKKSEDGFVKYSKTKSLLKEKVKSMQEKSSSRLRQRLNSRRINSRRMIQVAANLNNNYNEMSTTGAFKKPATSNKHEIQQNIESFQPRLFQSIEKEPRTTIESSEEGKESSKDKVLPDISRSHPTFLHDVLLKKIKNTERFDKLISKLDKNKTGKISKVQFALILKSAAGKKINGIPESTVEQLWHSLLPTNDNAMQNRNGGSITSAQLKGWIFKKRR